mgnify:FL=1
MKDTKQQWFKDAKYGLFIHFGLFSLLGGVYKGKETQGLSEWIMNDMNIPEEEYRALIKEFNPTYFSAKYIVSKAKEWGMRYIVLTVKHHEGFALYNSRCSSYNVMNTPYGKDILKEMQQECLQQGIVLGVYYSQAQDWDDPNGYRSNYDNSQKQFEKYLHEKCLPQIKEILTGYGPLGIMWFDTPMQMTEAQSREIFNTVKRLQPSCIVSGRIGNGIGEYMTAGDNSIPAEPFPGDWEVPATLNDTWGYSKVDDNWKNPQKLIRLLLKINSRGGNYLLNIGPKPDGTLPEETVRILNEVGKYVRENEDSIFGTMRLPKYPYEIPEVLFTAKLHKLFIHVIEPICKPNLYLLNIGNRIQKVTLLKTDEELQFENGICCEGEHFINIFLPVEFRKRAYYCLCVEYAEENPEFEPIRDCE